MHSIFAKAAVCLIVGIGISLGALQASELALGAQIIPAVQTGAQAGTFHFTAVKVKKAKKKKHKHGKKKKHKKKNKNKKKASTAA
jgi:hypothetical protein